MYLGYPTITKQYLRSLGGGGAITVSDSSGDCLRLDSRCLETLT